MEPTTNRTTGLWTTTRGHVDAPRTFLALHGFTQTHRSWDPVAAKLASAGRSSVIAVDLPGHGRSTDIVAADLWDAASLVEATLPDRPVTVVGYSMGGRIALHLALLLARRQQLQRRIDRLVLIGATAGIDDDETRRQRQRDDKQLAERALSIGVDAFLDEWLAGPLFASLDPALAGREHRRSNTAAGLASSLRTVGTGNQRPLWGDLGEVTCPVEVLVGGLDAKFRELGSRLVGALPTAQLTVIEGAGHACHLEQPDDVTTILLR